MLAQPVLFNPRVGSTRFLSTRFLSTRLGTVSFLKYQAMSNPFRSLQYLPWTALLLSGGLTILVATALDIILLFSLSMVPAIYELYVNSLLLQFVTPVAAAYGIGALSIVLTLNFFRQIPLRADTIWALTGCVLLMLLLKSQFSAPYLFVHGPDYFSLVAIAVGAFTQGQRYWR